MAAKCQNSTKNLRNDLHGKLFVAIHPVWKACSLAVAGLSVGCRFLRPILILLCEPVHDRDLAIKSRHASHKFSPTLFCDPAGSPPYESPTKFIEGSLNRQVVLPITIDLAIAVHHGCMVPTSERAADLVVRATGQLAREVNDYRSRQHGGLSAGRAPQH